jgi:small ligand-binding sensory domain FIST
MTRFASALSQHPIAANAVGEAAGEILEHLDGEGCDLAVCFASTHHVGAFEDIGPALRNILEPRVLVGGTAVAVAGGPHEIEENPALTVFAARLDGATLTPVTLRVQETPDGAALTGWPSLDQSPGSLLLFADPFTFPVDAFLQRVNRDLPGLQIIGGLASAAGSPGGNRLVLDDHVVDEGAVGVFVDGGGIEVRTLVSQGCRPIGRPYVVTRGDQNLIEELGGKPAIERLQELAGAASEEERELLRRGLHVGLVVDEHKAEFSRGDFLVRNLLGADESSGALAVGEQVSVGQTVQFHVRDARAADEDLRRALEREAAALAGRQAAGALLFTCNGRGSRMFAEPDHDAGLVAAVLGEIPVAGLFCAGELGPVGGRNFLHTFTASIALFR